MRPSVPVDVIVQPGRGSRQVRLLAADRAAVDEDDNVASPGAGIAAGAGCCAPIAPADVASHAVSTARPARVRTVQ